MNSSLSDHLLNDTKMLTTTEMSMADMREWIKSQMGGAKKPVIGAPLEEGRFQNYIQFVDQNELYIFAVNNFLIAIHDFEIQAF
ncbi:hypothetical protein GCK72_002959 [Caenorhabditis remanei]|uniref:Uncharacterized protein n=1 Tax=Caenorhabditis remanei TaxID=31234 RepID=A0A6A5HWF7_CAERE|nr:hypothetical protein GCK72_002959 [Caenorhabditis remanei]KAF1771134.1 hypothetical protein GCK72_002959 [Caenorhabditis remanei]